MSAELPAPLVAAVLADAAVTLAAAGIDSPRVDADVLLADLLGLPRSRLRTRDTLSAADAAAYAERIARRAAREPVQHITGVAPFRHVLLRVGPGVFVPRPETELLVDAVLSHLRTLAKPTVVDLCSGSGALALAIAGEVPAARVIAVENDSAALRWLGENTEGSSVRVVAADVRDAQPLRSFAGRVDAVVANPPYVPAAATIAPEVLADPAVAVFAGADGLDLVPAVLDRAAEVLAPGGVLALEHDEAHGADVPRLLRADGRFDAIVAHRDLTGRARYATAARR